MLHLLRPIATGVTSGRKTVATIDAMLIRTPFPWFDSATDDDIVVNLQSARRYVGQGLCVTALACGVSLAVAQPLPPSQWGPYAPPSSLRDWMGHHHNHAGPDQSHRMSQDERQQLRRQLIERERNRRAVPVPEGFPLGPPPPAPVLIPMPAPRQR